MNTRFSELRQNLEQARAKSAAELRAAEESFESQRGTMQAALDQRAVDERLAYPIVEGDVEAVGVHHFGGRLVTQNIGERLDLLQQKIVDAARKSDQVPLLFVSRNREFLDDIAEIVDRTILILVDSARATSCFRSTRSVSREHMHAFTHEQADVEHLELHLLGRCAIARGLIDDYRLSVEEASESLSLHSSNTAEGGRGHGHPSEYAFSDSEDDFVLNFAARDSCYSEHFVGWQEISQRMTRSGMSARSAYDNLRGLVRDVGLSSPYGAGDSKAQRVFRELDRLESASARLNSRLKRMGEQIDRLITTIEE